MSMSVPGNSCRTNRCCTPPSQGCLVRVSGECAYYSGSNITGPGINTGDNLNIVVNKLSEYISGGPGTVTSVGLIMPFGFTVTGSPVTSSGTLVVTAPNEWVSVNDYGAVGDGTTNDTTAIQNALNSGAKCILFAQGTYLITSSLLLNSNTSLFGYGATILRGAAIDNMMRNNADGVTGVYDANQNIKMYGLAFNGNAATFATQCTLLAIGHAKNIELKDCEFYNIPTWHGTELCAVQNAIVNGCSYHDGNGEELLQLDLMLGSGQFPWFGPYDNTPCNGIIVTDSIFYNATGVGGSQGGGLGSHSGGDPYQHSDIVWSNNVFRNLFGNAMKGHNYRNLVISGNVVDGCRNGITGTSDSNPSLNANYTIVGNHISNAVQASSSDGRAINIFRVKGIVINGNTVTRTHLGGINLGTCDDIVVTNNIMKDIGISTAVDTYGISIGTSNNVTITNNTIYKSTAGLASGVNTIGIGVNSVGTVVAGGINFTVENNTVSTPGSTTKFSNLLNSTIVGNNIINNLITPFISTKTIDYTYTPTDSALNVDTTAGNIVITVNPAIFNKNGLVVRKTTADANTVTITPSSGTINGAASMVLSTLDQSTFIRSDWVNLVAT